MKRETEERYSETNRSEAPELYWRVYDLLSPTISLIHRVKAIGLENLPAYGEGGCIVAGLHNGALDAMFIAIAAGRKGRALRWVGDEGICNAPVIGKIVRDLGIIPIASHRGAGTDPEKTRASLNEAATAIQNGGTIGLFPEGQIHSFMRGRKPMPFKTGIIRLAIETGAPIIPAWGQGVGAIFPWISPVTIKKAEIYMMIPFWSPRPVKVHFGKPFIVDKNLDIAASYEELKKECGRLELAFEDFVYSRKENSDDCALE